MKLPFAFEECVMVHDALSGFRVTIRNHGVTHLVVNDVLDEPARDECAIEQRMNADEFVAFLDGAEHDLVCGTIAPLLSPHDLIPLQAVPKVAGVQLVEDLAQIEMPSLFREQELPLHWQFGYCGFALLRGHRDTVKVPRRLEGHKRRATITLGEAMFFPSRAPFAPNA